MWVSGVWTILGEVVGINRLDRVTNYVGIDAVKLATDDLGEIRSLGIVDPRRRIPHMTAAKRLGTMTEEFIGLHDHVRSCTGRRP